MRTSDTTAAFDEAFAKAQGMMKSAEKSGTGQVGGKTGEARKYGYATLDAVIDAIRIPLSSNGLSWKQTIGVPLFAEGGLFEYPITTRISHASGEFNEEETRFFVNSYDPKIIGSSITYFRRYTLMAICGLAPEDDDGDAASGAAKQQRRDNRQMQQSRPQADAVPDQEAITLRHAITAYLECLPAGTQEKAFEAIRKAARLDTFAIPDLNNWPVENLRVLQSNIAKWQTTKPVDAPPSAAAQSQGTDVPPTFYESGLTPDAPLTEAEKAAASGDDELDDPFADN